MNAAPDVIDTLAGIAGDPAMAAIRARRAQAQANAQASYQALFEPDDPGEFPVRDRFAVAAFVAGLQGVPEAAAFYASKLDASGAAPDLAAAVRAETERGAATGPFGRYPAGPLSREDAEGPVLRVSDEGRRVLGAPLSAALEHAHLLLFRPRDASPEAMRALEGAGWSATGIVTLSQLVAFLSFQVRAAHGLWVLARTAGSAA